MELLLNSMVLPVTFPLAAGILCLLLPKAFDRARSVLATVASAITVLIVCRLLLEWKQLPGNAPMILSGSAWGSLRLDHLSSFILLVTTVFGFLISLYSMGYMRGKERLREYYAWLLGTIGIACGVILANNLLLLLIFWGLLGFALYVMIGIAGPEAAEAAKKSLIIVGGSDCLLMLGVTIVWVLADTLTLSSIRMDLADGIRYVAFFCFAIAALAKAGAMPFHSWVPDCGAQAPASVAAFLPAALDKLLGIYLLVRLTTGMFVMNTAMNTLLMLVGAGTIICAVMMALVQHDLKRLLSYHAVSQVGYMVLGIGTGTALGIAGGLFHMLNNTIYKSALFLCAGSVEKKTGTTDLDNLGGLAKVMPLTFVSCLVAALAISGIPPLNGFYSKWMIYQAMVDSGRNGNCLWLIFLATAMFGSALTLASFVKVLHAVFLCKRSAELRHRDIREVGFSMWLPGIGLACLCVIFGVFAYQLPLATMIFPAVGGVVQLSGAWYASVATVLLLAAYALGVLVYLLSTVRKARSCNTYIGGEIMEEVFHHKGTDGKVENVEVTGVDFYKTVEDLSPLREIFGAARAKLFDIYDLGGKVSAYFWEILRAAHGGLLPMYLTWVLAGLLVLLWMLFSGGRVAI
ncbi:MAG: proton-conducting transporter membrane subunit [Kiritimatiellaeota bacterium]|nr:proton-conducting transporter membrane subunit [Kiritimatiellota bacterium]